MKSIFLFVILIFNSNFAHSLAIVDTLYGMNAFDHVKSIRLSGKYTGTMRKSMWAINTRYCDASVSLSGKNIVVDVTQVENETRKVIKTTTLRVLVAPDSNYLTSFIKIYNDEGGILYQQNPTQEESETQFRFELYDSGEARELHIEKKGTDVECLNLQKSPMRVPGP